jgi:signal peptidase I
LKYGNPESEFVVSKNEILPLSGEGLKEVLQTTLAKKASLRFQAKGFSMTPFIRDGDIVTVSPLTNKTPSLGDIVAFVHPASSKLVIHRIINKKGNRLIINGDNCPVSWQDSVPKSNVLGYITKMERNNKKVWLGLGPEKSLIAFLSRLNIFVYLLLRWKNMPACIKKIIR